MFAPDMLEFWVYPTLWPGDSDNTKFWMGNSGHMITYCSTVKYVVYQDQEVTQELFLKRRRIMLLRT